MGFLLMQNLFWGRLVLLALLYSYANFIYSQKIIFPSESQITVIDSSYFIRVDQLSDSSFKASAVKPFEKRTYFFNPQTDQSVWYTFKIQNLDSLPREWMLVSYNYSINEIDLKIESDKQVSEWRNFRDTLSISEREIGHKQPVFTLNFLPGETKTFYVRIKNESSYEYPFAIFTENLFFSNFLKEYILYGIFYGLMLFVFVYSFLYYLFLKEKVAIIYSLFVAFQILYMLFRDGNGLFLVPSYTHYADLFKNIFRTGLCMMLLLYPLYFFKVNPGSRLFKVVLVLIGLRVVYTFFTFDYSSFFIFASELIFAIIATSISIYYYFTGFRDARYLIIGLGLLSVGYFFTFLSFVGVVTFSYNFFLLYYSMALESIFMTMALTDRVKRIRLDSLRKEQINKELEDLVASRTALLEQQSKELNLFLYSASHDLKGPLKTIRGICNVALMDKNVNHEDMYKLILGKLQKLESNINDLNAVTRIRNASSSQKAIDFKMMIEEIKDSFAEYPGYKETQIDLKINTKFPYQGDYFAMRIIAQNIIENAIKYRDRSKRSQLIITISDVEDEVYIVFEDNGQGITEEQLPHIFEMFYRANEESKEDTGLGLYIVKLAVHKLGGRVEVESKIGKGTRFNIFLPRHHNQEKSLQ